MWAIAHNPRDQVSGFRVQVERTLRSKASTCRRPKPYSAGTVTGIAAEHVLSNKCQFLESLVFAS